MEIGNIVQMLRRYWRSILVTLVVVAGVASGLLMRQPPVYASTATVNFVPKVGGAAGQLQAAMDFAQQQAVTYAQLADSVVVLEPVRAKLGLQESATSLAGRVTATASGTQPVVWVNSRGGDPAKAAELANAVAQQVLAAVKDYSPSGADQVIEARITSPAVPAQKPVSPVLLNSLIMALAAGLIAGLGQAVAREFLNNRVETPADVSKFTKTPVIGEIPFEEEAGRKKDVKTSGFSVRSEAYRRLRTNLQFRALEKQGNLMVVTSSIPGEGKTATAFHVASTFAQSGQRVLLIDCDLRRPRVHTVLDLDNEVGLSTALLHGGDHEPFVQEVDGVHVLTSGPKPPNPAELLNSPVMAQCLEEASAAYDVVVLDSPPLLPVTDATILAKLGAGAIVVADTTAVRRNQLATALKNLHAVDAPVHGIVLNKIKVGGPAGYYSYGYKYDYQYQDGQKEKVRTKLKERRSGSSRATRAAEEPRGRRKLETPVSPVDLPGAQNWTFVPPPAVPANSRTAEGAQSSHTPGRRFVEEAPEGRPTPPRRGVGEPR